MNRAKAWKLLKAKWGDNARLKCNEEALIGEEKKAVSEKLKQHRINKPRKKEDFPAWKKEEGRLFALAVANRYEAGYMAAIPGYAPAEMFSIRGSGDTIEEAVTKALAR